MPGLVGAIQSGFRHQFVDFNVDALNCAMTTGRHSDEKIDNDL